MIKGLYKDMAEDMLVFKLPLHQLESNCYEDENNLNEVANLVGVCCEKEHQYTISQSIDMAYAGKPPQEGSPYICFDDKEELKKACKLLGLDIMYK